MLRLKQIVLCQDRGTELWTNSQIILKITQVIQSGISLPKMFESLKIIFFTEAQSLRGDDRDRVIIQRLKTLEAATQIAMSKLFQLDQGRLQNANSATSVASPHTQVARQ